MREAAEKHLRRKVTPVLMAERTPGSDGLRRHRLHRRDILAATLTVNHYALQAFRSGNEDELDEKESVAEDEEPAKIGRDF